MTEETKLALVASLGMIAGFLVFLLLEILSEVR